MKFVVWKRFSQGASVHLDELSETFNTLEDAQAHAESWMLELNPDADDSAIDALDANDYTLEIVTSSDVSDSDDDERGVFDIENNFRGTSYARSVVFTAIED